MELESKNIIKNTDESSELIRSACTAGYVAPRVLVACEMSGRVREAFNKRGFEAWSCDLVDSEIPGRHYKCDVRDILGLGWDLMIGHPPCTYIANSGVRWLFEKPGRWEQLDDACRFFNTLKNAPIDRICIENPIPHKWGLERIGNKYTQKVQPYYFGDKQKKTTCLWLKNLPLLVATTPELKPPKDKEEAKKWEMVWRMPPGENQAKERSRTFQGIADAMAEQWGNVLTR
jgi:hypothetical protein